MRYLKVISKFILILLQHEMHFEAGPWHCFGEEMLNKLMDIAPGLVHHSISSHTAGSVPCAFYPL